MQRLDLYKIPHKRVIKNFSFVKEEVRQLTNQIDSLIIFSIVNFAYIEFRKSSSDGEIAATMGLSLLLLVCAVNIIQKLSGKIDNLCTLLVTVLKTLLSFVGAQAVINTITIHEIHSGDKNLIQKVMSFVESTIILIVAAILPNSVKNIQWCQRCISIILFMYTDAIDKFLSSFGGRGLFLLVFAAAYTLLMSWNPASIEKTALTYYPRELSLVVRALKLFTINTSTQILLEQSQNSQEQITTACLVVVFTSFISILCPYYKEAHGYAMWAVSRILSDQFEHLIKKTVLIVIINVLFILFFSIFKSSGFMRSFMQLTLLVTLNTFLNIVNSLFFTFNGFEKLLILFVSTLCIHVIIANAK